MWKQWLLVAAIITKMNVLLSAAATFFISPNKLAPRAVSLITNPCYATASVLLKTEAKYLSSSWTMPRLSEIFTPSEAYRVPPSDKPDKHQQHSNGNSAQTTHFPVSYWHLRYELNKKGDRRELPGTQNKSKHLGLKGNQLVMTVTQEQCRIEQKRES